MKQKAAKIEEGIRYLKSCHQCSTSYRTNEKPQKYCSRRCYYSARKHMPRLRTGSMAVCPLCSKQFYNYPSRQNTHCSRLCGNKARTGSTWSEQRRKNFVPYWKGKTLSEETRRKISQTRIERRITYPTGSASPAWKGGITPINKRLRHRKRYKNWRFSVFKRDNWTCLFCGIRNKKGLGSTVKLQADHIKPFAFFPNLRYKIANGRTLCLPCHRATPTWGARAFKYEKT